jgi:energy-coupling factor transporter ATP-binding protein EcfA2
VLLQNSERHLERFSWAPREGFDPDEWPFTIPAVRQLVDEGGFDVPAGVTILVGENGSGKSTLIEAFAAVYPRRGAESSSPIPVTGPAGLPEDSPLRWHLKAKTHRLAADRSNVHLGSRLYAEPGGRWDLSRPNCGRFDTNRSAPDACEVRSSARADRGKCGRS